MYLRQLLEKHGLEEGVRTVINGHPRSHFSTPEFKPLIRASPVNGEVEIGGFIAKRDQRISPKTEILLQSFPKPNAGR